MNVQKIRTGIYSNGQMIPRLFKRINTLARNMSDDLYFKGYFYCSFKNAPFNIVRHLYKL